MSNSRLNIGLYVSNLVDESVYSVCKGASAAASDINANLIIFPGMHLNGDYNDPLKSPYYYQYNTIYDMGGHEGLDLLIIMTGIIGNTLGSDDIQKFLSKFSDTPILTISSEYEGCHSIRFDNEIGFSKAINHLIHKHNCRRIGFVSGSKLNADAQERLDIYRRTLLENGLPFDNNLVVYGNFSEYCDAEVQDLIKNNTDIDAICFANDEMAKGGYRVLKNSRYIIGKNIHVIGFDNSTTATNLYPLLTTVNADNFELGYKAVANVPEMLSSHDTIRYIVSTKLIVRNSCGCKNTSYDKLSYMFSDSKMNKEQLSAFSTDDYISYLFGENETLLYSHHFSRYEYENIKICFKNFFEIVLDYASFLKPKNYRKAVQNALQEIISTGILKIMPIDTFFNIIDTLYCKVTSTNKTDDDIGFVFSQIYRELSTYTRTCSRSDVISVHHIDTIIGSIVNDVIITGESNDQAFYPIMKRLSDLGIKRSYLLLFDVPVMHSENTELHMPEHIYMRFSQEDDHIRYTRNHGEMLTEKIFLNDFIQQKNSATLVINPLFSNEKLYGLIVCDMKPELYKYLNKIGLQISTALKYNELLNNWQITLADEKENSKNFENISKHDELTGVFNRRGYYENAQKIISNPANAGKNAIVVFADMDNLKVINDRFGHDDGDYSLKSIADILLRSFRTTDIVGRIGGDEFAVFALLGGSENIEHITNRITTTSERFNEKCSKPYYVNMSLGIYPFECGENIVLSDIMENADALLYKQKKNKRKSVLKDMKE